MATVNGLLIVERILRDRDGVWEQIGEERDLGRLTRDMLLSSSAALGCYGAVLGASNTDNPVLQAVVSALKLPLLFLVTLAICLPTLYLFNLVFGARLQVRQALALVLVAITVIATLALAFAPISLFFLITANHYSFFKLLNVAILGLSALVGLRFLTAGMAALNRHNAERAAAAREAVAPVARAASEPDRQVDDEPEPALVGASKDVVPAGAGNGATAVVAKTLRADGQPAGRPVSAPSRATAPRPGAGAVEPTEGQASMALLYVWILLFGFVGTQLAWTLRPFFGSPGEKFEIFRSIDGNFYVDIVRTLGHLF